MDIQRLVPAIPSESINRWFVGHVLGSAYAVRDYAVEAQFLAECVNGYLEWYLIESHPWIIPHRLHVDDVKPSHARGPSNDVFLPPPLPHGEDDTQRLQFVVVIMDNHMGLVSPLPRFILWHHINHT